MLISIAIFVPSLLIFFQPRQERREQIVVKERKCVAAFQRDLFTYAWRPAVRPVGRPGSRRCGCHERLWGYNDGLCWQTPNGLITIQVGEPRRQPAPGLDLPWSLKSAQIWNSLADDDDPC
jgi:hypothetical protein